MDKNISKLYVKFLSCFIFLFFLAFYYGLAYPANVTLQWNSVAEATGYKVYCGTASRSYQITDDVGNITNHNISLDSGTYFFAVTAYNNYGESGYSEEVLTTIADMNPPTSVSLTSDLPSPQPEGTTVTFTAQADGGSGNYEYKYFVKDPLDQWSIVRGYSLEPDYIWTAMGKGESAIQVWARNAGAGVDYSVLNTISFSTEMNPPTSLSISADLPSPQTEGTTVTFTAQATGGSGDYEYSFYLKDPSDQWSLVREYSWEPTYTWTATGNGESAIQVCARNTGADVNCQIYNTMTYTVESLNLPTATALSFMHVSEINMSLRKLGANIKAIAKVMVLDNDGNPVEGAKVYGSWSGITSDTDCDLTDSNGSVFLESDRLKKPTGIFVFTVDNLAKDGWDFDSSSNAETSDSIVTSYSK